MIILTIRTDKPEAELGLFEGEKRLAYETWTAHRQLAETLHQQIARLLQSLTKDWNNIEGVVAYKGPGSFTGLRIGLTVGNALAHSLGIPIVAQAGNDWREVGTNRLLNGDDDSIALPEYDSPAHITSPKK